MRAIFFVVGKYLFLLCQSIENNAEDRKGITNFIAATNRNGNKNYLSLNEIWKAFKLIVNIKKKENYLHKQK